MGNYPNYPTVVRLTGALLAEQHAGWDIACRHLSEHTLATLNEPRDTDPAQLEQPG